MWQLDRLKILLLHAKQKKEPVGLIFNSKDKKKYLQSLFPSEQDYMRLD